MHAPYASPPRFDKPLFVKHMKDIGRGYRMRAIKLVIICRTFAQAGADTLSSYDELRSVLQVVDDALYSATEAREKTTKDADAKFEKAVDMLAAYEEKYHFRVTVPYEMAEAGAEDKSSSKVLMRLMKISRPLKVGPTKIVEFLIHKSLSDKNPTIVKQVLSQSSDMKEILWNFSRFKDERRLTLRDNPHFYERLPTTAEKYNSQFRTNPVETYLREKISVLTDNPRLTGRVFLETARKKRAFGNVWCPKEALIFKDTCGKLEGENIIGSAIENTPNLWCFEEPPLSNASWPSPPDRSSPSLMTATPITSTTGALLADWRGPILRMLRSQSVDINIRISDNPPTDFSTGYSEPSSPSPSPDPSSVISRLRLSLLPTPASNAAPRTGPAVPYVTICPLPDTSSRGVSRAGTATIFSQPDIIEHHPEINEAEVPAICPGEVSRVDRIPSQADTMTIFPQPRIIERHAEINEVERNNAEVMNEADSDVVSISNSENLENVVGGSVDMKGSKYSLDFDN